MMYIFLGSRTVPWNPNRKQDVPGGGRAGDEMEQRGCDVGHAGHVAEVLAEGDAGPLDPKRDARHVVIDTIVLFESTRKLGHRGLIAQNPGLHGKLNTHCRSPLIHGKLLN